MSTHTCNVPERRAKDHKHRLLAVGAAFLAAFFLLLAAAFQVMPYPALFIPACFLCAICGTASVLSFWIWWDIRND